MITTGETLTLDGAWSNAAGSTISASGGTLNLGDQSSSSTNAWSNLGTITATNSTVNLGGQFSVADLGTFNRNGGAVNLTGTLDDTGEETTQVQASSSYPGDPPAAAFDGSLNTEWNSGGFTGTITAKFSVPLTFDRVLLFAVASPTTSETYTIYGSNDGVSFNQLAQSTQAVPSTVGPLAPIVFSTTTAQYLRISVNGNASWVAIYEVELMLGSTPVPTPDTLTLNSTTGSWNLQGGTISGGTVSESGGAELAITSSGGALNGVTVNGPLDLTANNANATVTNGLTLDGTATLGYEARLYFSGGSQTLAGTGTVVFNNAIWQGLIADSDGMTLTIGAGITIDGGNSQGNEGSAIGYSYGWGGGSNTSVVNQGTINADTPGMSIVVIANGSGTFTNQGTLSASNGGTLYVNTSVANNGSGVITSSPLGDI